MTITSRAREFRFTERDFNSIRELVRQETGIKLSDTKQDMVYNRLARRLRQLGLTEFEGYLRLLKDETDDELIQFTNAITTNVTSFFREPHHFNFLAEKLLPHLMESRTATRRLRFWSAGCSTGEEPYSLAMVLRESVPAEWDVKILATDLDSAVLETAGRGIYPEKSVTGIPARRLRRWFRAGRGSNKGLVRVVPELQSLIRFRQLNLLHPFPFAGPFDAIFCRNVVIYFDKETQRDLFDRYADVTASTGHLFLGHSESMFKVCDRYRLIGATIYERIP